MSQKTPAMDPDGFAARLDEARSEIAKVIVGQTELVEKVLVAVLCEGHLLLEGVPGLGKTRLLTTLGQVLQIGFGRVSFTPDLMPADILGTNVLQAGEFSFHPGPVFTNLVLADEINRATPKTQSALLEAMAERRVTVAGATRPLPRPFMVMATQNPLEMADPGQSLESVRENLFQMHLSESHRGTLGSGQVKWDEYFSTLKKINYQGWLVIEAFGTADPAIVNAANIWRNAFDSPEQLYRDGIGFIKSHLGACASNDRRKRL